MAKKQSNEKPKKRGNGEGTFRERNGRQTLEVMVGVDPTTGKPKRKYFTGKSEAEARKFYRAYMDSVAKGTFVEPNKITLSQWLTTWFDLYKKNSVQRSTLDTIEVHIESHLKPALGHIKLQKLRAQEVQKMYNDKFNNGFGLKHETLRHIHATLRQALDKAIEEGYITKNPANGCIVPKDLTLPEENVLYEEDLKKIVEALDLTNTKDMAIFIAISTGLRIGEIIPILWEDIDFDRKLLSVNKAYSNVKKRGITDGDKEKSDSSKNEIMIKSPKTKSSVRKVPLSDDIVDILRSHEERIEKMILDGKDQFINCKLIFPNRNGSFFSPTTLRDRWKNVKSRAGISKNVTFHGLRHSFTTFQLQNSTDIKSIQTILGHSKLSTTMGIYSHANEASQRKAISKITYLLPNKENEDKIKEASIEYPAS
jgi:integrase